MHGDVLLYILLIVLGCAAFFFGVIYSLGRFMAWITRGLVGILSPRRRGGRGGYGAAKGCDAVGSRARTCQNERCLKVEYRDARYCSRCGAPLSQVAKHDRVVTK